ncbi:MAG: hypothetical protein Q4G52_03820 [Clostridia bacterium]|nr:hypothetical protein [Clostridia bacterium]
MMKTSVKKIILSALLASCLTLPLLHGYAFAAKASAEETVTAMSTTVTYPDMKGVERSVYGFLTADAEK